MPIGDILGTPKILLVEDNEADRDIAKELLESFDYLVDCVGTGEEAVTACSVAQYAAVLMDLTLPRMDGFETTRRLRELGKRTGKYIPVIALTGRTESEDRASGTAVGMDDFLNKPFEPEHLRRVLLRILYSPDQPNLKLLKGYQV